ncbi:MULTISPECIES: FAD:protein FMN transferase [Aminobacter]|nr:FAD:protein FMN transferase [Aminobacter niigataensis]
MRAMGRRPDGETWTVAVELPDPDRRAPHSVLSLQDSAVATSGDYRHWVEVQGRRLSHTMDPRRGTPLLDAPASVTVVRLPVRPRIFARRCTHGCYLLRLEAGKGRRSRLSAPEPRPRRGRAPSRRWPRRRRPHRTGRATQRDGAFECRPPKERAVALGGFLGGAALYGGRTWPQTIWPVGSPWSPSCSWDPALPEELEYQNADMYRRGLDTISGK